MSEEPEYKEVDLGDKKLKVTADVAEALIAYRDSNKSQLNELRTQLNNVVKDAELAKNEKEKIEKQKQEEELLKEGKMEALKSSIAKEWQDKVAAYEEKTKALQNKILDGEIKSSVASVEGVNTAAIQDIAILIRNAGPELKDDGIYVGDKKLQDFAKETVESRDYFRVVKTPAGTGKGVQPSDGKAQPGKKQDIYTQAADIFHKLNG